MRQRTRSRLRWTVLFRFYLGALTGIAGLGLMSGAFFPVRIGQLAAGVLLLVAGLGISIGLISGRRPEADSGAPGGERRR